MTLWQTQYWQELLRVSHQAQKTFEIDGVFLEKRSLGFGQFWLFALGVEQHQSIHFEKIKKLCREENALFVQVEMFGISEFNSPLLNSQNFPSPPTPLPKSEGSSEIPLLIREGLGEGFKTGYYKKFITPYTALIDLSKTLDEILSLMKPKGRYNIKVAEKKWLQAQSVEKTSENIKIFYDLMCETTSRDHFFGNSMKYYEDFLRIIPRSELIFVKSEEKVVSAGIFVFWEEISLYYYGASTSDTAYRNMMWPYLMQYFSIQKAQEMGSKWYDFLWVATPWDEKSSLAGVTDFKSKFTSDFREVSRSYLYVAKPFLYGVFQLLRKLKK